MKRFVIAAAAIALLGASSAAADSQVPEGFSVASRLGPAASFVAGKPVAVNCAASQYDWQQFLDSSGLTIPDLNGATVPGSSAIYLAPNVCTNLGRQLAKKTVDYNVLGPSLLVLVHESIHDRGERDEGVTDCDAIHEMPKVAVKFFGVKSGKQLRSLMAAAWAYRANEPAAYRAKC